uniref:Uncharacterized protein n=1 Tax=Cucumis melo TaxID=3656 RepID=A0A9I9E6S8_CUCME
MEVATMADFDTLYTLLRRDSSYRECWADPATAKTMGVLGGSRNIVKLISDGCTGCVLYNVMMSCRGRAPDSLSKEETQIDYVIKSDGLKTTVVAAAVAVAVAVVVLVLVLVRVLVVVVLNICVNTAWGFVEKAKIIDNT